MLGFSGGTVVKNLSANAGDIDMCSDPWVGKMPWSRKQQTTPVFFLENSMDKEAWQATVHEITESQTWLSDWAHMHHILSIYCMWILDHMPYLDYLVKPCSPAARSVCHSTMQMYLRIGHSEHKIPRRIELCTQRNFNKCQ